MSACGIIEWVFGLLNFLDRTIFKGIVFTKNQFLTFGHNGLSRLNEQKILFFFYAIFLRIFCSTIRAKFEKNRTESNEVAIRIMYGKKIRTERMQ